MAAHELFHAIGVFAARPRIVGDLKIKLPDDITPRVMFEGQGRACDERWRRPYTPTFRTG